jgi:23S rRNA pseudouridine2605 synthase
VSGVRIQKYLADCGVGSRREAERLVGEGRVRVNGAPAAFGQFVAPGDAVTVDGDPVAPAERLYLLVHKPRGVMAEFNPPGDAEGLDAYVRGVADRLFPVDPLPRAAAGAMLLTNDGGLVQALNRPGCDLDKTYVVTVEGLLSDGVAARIRDGVYLGEGPPVRARVLVLHPGVRTTVVRVVTPENRGVRVNRLLDAAGYPPLEIRRTAVGAAELGGLAPGAWRPLDGHELHAIRRAVAAVV